MEAPEPSGAGTRNSGQFGRSLTISGHVCERSSGCLASSSAAHRSHRRWSGFRSRSPSCCRPDTVSDSGEIANRVAAKQTITTVGLQFAGPPVGSLLFAVAVALPFGVDAASFALSAALLATLPRRRRRRERIDHPPMRTAIADGLRWLARHRLLRTLAVLLGVNTFCFQLGNVSLVLLATQTLRLDAPGYGLLLAGAAIGSLLGGLVSARLVKRMGELPALLAALVTNVVIFVGIGLSPNVIVLGALLAVNGFVTTLWSIVTVSLRQRIVASEMLGRVNSVYRMLGWGLIPLGALAGGLVAHTFGLRAPYPIAGVLRGIALLVAMPALIRAMRD
ncbi:MFS transporter [Nonomuraea sp. NEAU-A123]|uniref:MFS transporter n=1 Tax=Nonomuraea sp. NEAU-A123 TaxID=2839649 RepID=UPI0020327019|nr:MFS transporter [Nonomuraea sp. NEAU-A123]